MNVRIVHATDPSARISTTVSQEPDESGGFMIPHRHLDHALTLGWKVEHEPGEGDPGAEAAGAEAAVPVRSKPKLRRAKQDA
jgi:hypothetical protein